jgi:hypothetical protein
MRPGGCQFAGDFASEARHVHVSVVDELSETMARRCCYCSIIYCSIDVEFMVPHSRQAVRSSGVNDCGVLLSGTNIYHTVKLH